MESLQLLFYGPLKSNGLTQIRISRDPYKNGVSERGGNSLYWNESISLHSWHLLQHFQLNVSWFPLKLMINRIPNSSLGVWTPLANLFGVSWNLYFQMLYAIHLYPSKVQIVCLFFIFIKILSRNYRTFSGSYDTWQTISYKLKTCFNWLLGACNERTSLRTGRYDKFIPWNTKYKAAQGLTMQKK